MKEKGRVKERREQKLKTKTYKEKKTRQATNLIVADKRKLNTTIKCITYKETHCKTFLLSSFSCFCFCFCYFYFVVV